VDRVLFRTQFLQLCHRGFPLGLKSLDSLLRRFAANLDFMYEADRFRLHPRAFRSRSGDRAGHILGPGRGRQQRHCYGNDHQTGKSASHGTPSLW